MIKKHIKSMQIIKIKKINMEKSKNKKIKINKLTIFKKIK